jgi:hypothetical protein
MVTRGERKLGRVIRKLGNSVEFSTKESIANESEKQYRERVRKLAGYNENSPVQSLRDPLIYKKKSTESSTA